MKRTFFNILLPFLMPLRDVAIRLGIIKHSGRQRFPVGFIARNVTKENVQQRLASLAFEGESCAWVDDGQLLSMRRRENDFQYHIRLFDDGEVRAHYELAVDCHPLSHLIEKVFEPRTKEVRKFFGDLLEPIQMS